MKCAEVVLVVVFDGWVIGGWKGVGVHSSVLGQRHRRDEKELLDIFIFVLARKLPQPYLIESALIPNCVPVGLHALPTGPASLPFLAMSNLILARRTLIISCSRHRIASLCKSCAQMGLLCAHIETSRDALDPDLVAGLCLHVHRPFGGSKSQQPANDIPLELQ